MRLCYCRNGKKSLTVYSRLRNDEHSLAVFLKKHLREYKRIVNVFLNAYLVSLCGITLDDLSLLFTVKSAGKICEEES